jgi:hypothetical protein
VVCSNIGVAAVPVDCHSWNRPAAGEEQHLVHSGGYYSCAKELQMVVPFDDCLSNSAAIGEAIFSVLPLVVLVFRAVLLQLLLLLLLLSDHDDAHYYYWSCAAFSEFPQLGILPATRSAGCGTSGPWAEELATR